MTMQEHADLPATLGDIPARAARRWPERTALWCEGHSWTYAEFEREVDRVGRALLAAGVQAGDRVALWIGNLPEYLFAFFGVLRAGAVAVPLNTRWRTRELQFALRHCEASLLISETRSGPIDHEQMLREALGDIRIAADGSLVPTHCTQLRRIVLLEPHQLAGAQLWGEFLARGDAVSAETLQVRSAAVDPAAMALVMYTSGTTGAPKGAMLSHGGGIRPSLERALRLATTAESVQLNYLPVFHIYSKIFAVLPTMLVGALQVLMNRFDAMEALRLVSSQRITVLHGFDTHYRDLLAALDAPGAAWDVSSLHCGTFSAGTETAKRVVQEVQQKLLRTISCFGQSETWGALTAGAVGCSLDQSSAASGMPLTGVEVRIVDPETGVDAPPGEVGEILIRSEYVMLGYYNAPAETRAVLDTAGWVHTGDAGYLRPDGHVRFMGRFKDMLKVGGENVDPAEIEALLLESPLVTAVAVVGYPDERLGEVAAAFIVPAAGALADDVAQQVEALCRGHIASFKIPRRIECVTQLPMGITGKIDKKQLRQRLEADGEGVNTR